MGHGRGDRQRLRSLDRVRERDWLEGGVVRGEAGSRWLGVAEQELGREQRQRKRKRKEKESRDRGAHACFGRKMVYRKFFRKLFSVFSLRIFQ